MDEAEYLADRIIIIGDGKLKCSGGVQFLKDKLGSGYHLIMSLLDDYDLEKLTKFIQEVIPSAQLDKFYGKEATYLLSVESSNLFPELFRKLDEFKDHISVQSYGISVTTMDEIFTKATSSETDLKQTSGIQQELLLTPFLARSEILYKNYFLKRRASYHFKA